MARRYRQGLASYRARTATSAFPTKRGPRPDSKAGRRQERRARLKGKLPKPGTRAAQARYMAWVPDTEEARWLHRASLSVTLDKRTDPEGNPYLEDLRALGEREYRKAYNEQQRERRPRHQGEKRKLSWTWVKRHKRQLPRRG